MFQAGHCVCSKEDILHQFLFQKKSIWLKSFSVPSQDFRHKLNRLPLRQGSLPKNKPTSGNNFLRGICQWRSKASGSSKTPVSWKQISSINFFWKKIVQFVFRLKSFSVLSQDFRHKLSRLPLRQGSLPKSKPTSGNNFLRRICQWRSKVSGSSKSPVSWKQNFEYQFFL